MRNVVVRPALKSDWHEISTLLRASALPLEGAQEHLSAYFVAVFDGAVVGTAVLAARKKLSTDTPRSFCLPTEKVGLAC